MYMYPLLVELLLIIILDPACLLLVGFLLKVAQGSLSISRINWKSSGYPFSYQLDKSAFDRKT